MQSIKRRRSLACMVGRLLTDKPINFAAMRNHFASLWAPAIGLFVRELEDSRYIFKFYQKVKMNRVITEGPWTFSNNLLLLHRLDPGENSNSVPLFKAQFWIRVYNMPIRFNSEPVAGHIGNSISVFVGFDANNIAEFWKSYLRIRVELDVRNPLMRWKKIKKPHGDPVLVKFQYEKLSPLCFLCGILGHTDLRCPLLLRNDDNPLTRDWSSFLKVQFRQAANAGGERWMRNGSNTVPIFNAASSSASVDKYQSGGNKIDARFGASFVSSILVLKPKKFMLNVPPLTVVNNEEDVVLTVENSRKRPITVVILDGAREKSSHFDVMITDMSGPGSGVEESSEAITFLESAAKLNPMFQE